MRRSAAVPLAVTSTLALALGGCSSSSGSRAEETGYQGVCVDERTQQRIADAECDDDDPTGARSSGLTAWYFFALGRRFPPVGAGLRGYRSGTDYVRTVPPGARYVAGGAAPAGGTVSGAGLSRSAAAPGARSGGREGAVTRGGLGGGSRGVSS